MPLQVVVFASDLLKAKELIDSSVPELFIQEHAGEIYLMRMRLGGNEAWLTPLEGNGVVQYLADEGLGNITVYMCRQERVAQNCRLYAKESPPLRPSRAHQRLWCQY